MNAKKIMGAVLVALLAAALFVGAGAADDPTDVGTVYAYTNLAAFTLSPYTPAAGDEFTAADGTIIAVVDKAGKKYFAADDAEYGKQYTGNGITFKLTAPNAVVSALDANGVSIIGKTVSKDVANAATFAAVSSVYTSPAIELVFIDENGVTQSQPSDFTAGKWGVVAALTGQSNLVTAPETSVVGQIYYFTVAKTEETISAAQDVVNIGNSIIVTVNVPGATNATIKYDDKVSVPTGQASQISLDTTNKEVKIRLGLDGTGSVAFTAEKTGKTTFKLGDAKVSVTIEEGVITAVADEEFFYIGSPIELSGTTTAGEDLNFYIEGTNFAFMQIDPTTMFGEDGLEFDGESWTVDFDSKAIVNTADNGKVLIAGTYTVVVSTFDAANDAYTGDMKKAVMDKTYGTAAVTMTQPFITDVEAAAVAVQGTDYKITGTAIAANAVKLYVFGTNYFTATTDDNLDEGDVFEFEIDELDTEEMAPGTYFYLIQHPMNDGIFNVWNATNSAEFYYAATVSDGTRGTPIFLFDAWKRGTNYAAQALLEAIAGQDIDDIFVQGTFEVEAQKLTINPIPAEVVKGSKLAITGSSNSGEGVEVIVNVLAGKFGATVKGDENSATFLTAKGVTKKDGTFEAAIDTSKLEVGNYIVTVEIDGTMYDSAAVEIVDKAPVTPVDPVDPKPVDPKPVDPQPTEPETPGFGALAALAGLGAVAVLLLRRE